MMVIVGALILWNLLISFVALTALLGGYNNHKDIEAIKSWYPFCEIMKMRIPKNKGGDTE